MPDNPEVKVTLTAEDQGVAAAIRELGRQLDTLKTKQEQTGASSQKLAQNFRNLSQQALDTVRLRIANIPGLGNFGSMLAVRAYEPVGKMLEESASGLEETFGSAAVAAGGFAAGLAAVGAIAVGVTHHMMELAQSIENTAAVTGLSTDQVQTFMTLADEMGLDADGLTQAFVQINRQIGEFLTTGKAAGAGTQNFARVMTQLGVSLKTATGEARPAEVVLNDFYRALQRIPDQATRTVLMDEALGRGAKLIGAMFAEATRSGTDFTGMLEKIQERESNLTPAQLAWIEQGKQGFDELKEEAGGFFKQLGAIVSFMTLHPLKALMAASGGPEGILEETNVPPPGMKTEKPETQWDREMAAQIKEVGDLAMAADEATKKLKQENEVLAAGGADRAALIQAEKDRGAILARLHPSMLAVRVDTEAQRQADLQALDALNREIPQLQRKIALEDERHKKKPFNEGDAARAQRVQFEQYTRRIAEGKRAMEGLLEIENQLSRAESESARRSIEEQAEKLRGEQHLEEERQRELTDAQKEAARLGGQIAEQGGDKTYELRAQLQTAEANAAKAASLGETQLSAAYAKQVEELKTLIQTQQQMITGSQALHTISESMQSGMQTLFDSIGRGAGSVREAFGQMEMAVIHSLENVATQMLANLALALMTDNLQKLSKAKLAAANTFASVSAIPVIGWILAPVAAAAAFAETLQFASGGLVRGAGGPTGDRIPAMLSNGEFVVHAGAVKSFGLDKLEAINAGIRTVSPEFMSSIARPADFRTPAFELPEAIAGGAAKNLHSYEEIHLHHSGPDALKVLREQLLPEIRDAFRRGELDFMRQP